LASPILLVKPLVVEILQGGKSRGIEFIPVTVARQVNGS
jgi:hypothetical protein